MHQETPVYSQFEPDYEFTGNLCKKIIDENQFGKLAFDRDDLVGIMFGHCSCIMFTKEPAAYELILYVHPEYRNGTIAYRLNKSFEDWANEKKANFLFTGQSLGINPETVNRMYLKLGYESFGNIYRKHLN